MSKAQNQPDNTVKISNNTGEVTGYRVHNFQYTTLGKIVLFRLLNNRDIKIVITSSGNTTGTGKTMLAIILARVITQYAQEIFGYQENWSANKYSFIDVWEYLEKYESCEGKVLITDELEYLADRRRSQSNQNVFFSQAWQMLRYKNNLTIGTAPSMANLDKRVPENTDIWINIQYPGLAYTYYVSMNDFTYNIMTKRMTQCGYDEVIRWEPIDNDPDYAYLTQEKSDQGVPGMDSEEALSEQDLKEAEKQTKEETALKVIRWKHEGKVDPQIWDQAKIGDLVGMSQQWVSNLKKRETDF